MYISIYSYNILNFLILIKAKKKKKRMAKGVARWNDLEGG